MQIRTKAEFYRLWKAGVLGNRPATFDTVAEAWASGVPYIGFRELGRAGGGLAEVVPRAQLHATATAWDATQRRYTLDGAAPDHRVQLQGELCRTCRGLEGSVAVRSGLHIRRAMEAGLFRPVAGVTAVALLRQYMDPSSQEDFWALLDLFPDAAVEFACYPMNVGVLPHRNTFFWEVRDY